MDTEKPIYEREGWKPMTADEIVRALDSLRQLPGSEMMYLPEFYCKDKGIDFEESNRTLSLKEAVEKKKPLTTKERLQAKLAEKKSQAIANGRADSSSREQGKEATQ